MARLRDEPATDDGDGMPEHLVTFRAGDWPADLEPTVARIRWTYARAAWRRQHGLRVWVPRKVVDR